MAPAVQNLQSSAAGGETIAALGVATATIRHPDLPFVDLYGNRQMPAAFMGVIHVVDDRAAAPQSSKADSANSALAQLQFSGHVGIPTDAALESNDWLDSLHDALPNPIPFSALRQADIIHKFSIKETNGNRDGNHPNRGSVSTLSEPRDHVRWRGRLCGYRRPLVRERQADAAGQQTEIV
jgi:hypothetical protein